MLVTIQKWGNSQGIRLPKTILDMLNIKENDKLELTQEADVITIRKAKSIQHKTLEERLTEFYGKPIDQIIMPKTEECDWGKPEGNEVW